MTAQAAPDFFGATTIRPPLGPELAPVEEARGAVGHAAVPRASNATREEFIRRALDA